MGGEACVSLPVQGMTTLVHTARSYVCRFRTDVIKHRNSTVQTCKHHDQTFWNPKYIRLFAKLLCYLCDFWLPPRSRGELAIFWVVTQRVVVIPCRCFVDSWPLKIGRIGCPETLLLTSSDLNDIQKFTSYLLENQLRRHYKSQSINVVWGKRSLSSVILVTVTWKTYKHRTMLK